MKLAIVGAGPAGASFAWLCAKHGVDVTLIESEPNFERTFRGEGLMPSGIDALSSMGLNDLLGTLPCRRLHGWDIFIDGRALFSVPEPVDELGERAVRIIPQAQFLEALIARCRSYANFRFVSDSTVRDLSEAEGRINGVITKSDEGVENIPADLVVGCDGRASLVRKRAGLDLTRLPENYNILWFRLPAPPQLCDESRMMMMVTKSHVAACYTSWDGALRFALMQTKTERMRLATQDWAEEIAKPAPLWLAEHIREHRNRIEEPVHLNVMVGRCEHWYRPGCLLLGDAAHPMSPIRAQGINLALRDAIVAANHLVPLFQAGCSPDELDAAAMKVGRERTPEIRRAQTLQHRDARGLNRFYTPAILALAKFLGPRLGRYRWAQQAWLRQQHDLRYGISDVQLRLSTQIRR